MKLPIFNIFCVLVFAVSLQGCSSIEKVEEQEGFVRTADIQPYIEQWDSNKEKIVRLGAIEEDLTLLIQALAMQTDINKLPVQMRDTLRLEKHGALSKQELKVENETSEAKIKKDLYGAKLRRFLVEKGALSQLTELQKKYPQLFAVLQYRIHTEYKDEVKFYSLVVGPVERRQQVNKLCLLFKQTGSVCSLIIF